MELNALLQEHFGTLAAEVEASIRWFGTSIEGIQPAYAVLIENQETFTQEEVRTALAFYGGDQWPAAVAAARADRPMLVINVLPDIVRASLVKHLVSGASPLTPSETRRLQVIVSRQNQNAQRLYNYLVSALAERVADAQQRFQPGRSA